MQFDTEQQKPSLFARLLALLHLPIVASGPNGEPGPPGAMGATGEPGENNPMMWVEYRPENPDKYPIIFREPSLTLDSLSEAQRQFLKNLKAKSGCKLNSVEVYDLEGGYAKHVVLNVSVLNPMPSLYLTLNIQRN